MRGLLEPLIPCNGDRVRDIERRVQRIDYSSHRIAAIDLDWAILELIYEAGRDCLPAEIMAWHEARCRCCEIPAWLDRHEHFRIKRIGGAS